MTTTNGNSSSTSRPPTGIKVIVGFGGLGAAIECHRQGHSVEMYESFAELKQLGDIISFRPNAGRIFYRWSDGEVVRRMRPLSINLRKYGFNIHKYDTGEIVMNQKTPEYSVEAPNFNGHKGGGGGGVHLGNRIHEYFEDEDESGIVLADGTKVKADITIAADGVRSQARKAVLGYEDKPKSSGYAVWRAWFSSKEILADPLTAQFCEDGGYSSATIKTGQDCCWVLTHPDKHNISESWSFPGKLSEVLQAIKDWDPMCKRIISETPESTLVDWKVVYRDPLPTWTSPRARILLLGDAAHYPFLPTSAQGATQALEDGVSIAVCLRKGGEENVQISVRAREKIRYDRVRETQKTGESTRDRWHKTDWERVRENPEIVRLPREDWIFDFDAERNAEETYDDVVKGLMV
ncbi:hypothetical protein GGS20DRAFT_599419 [Poronia punctata]|nr:hypothetical protein GGS20DRAFT_599419 [Poronia punctata]